MRGELARRLVELFQQAAEVNQWGLYECQALPDHVHLFLQFSPSESVAEVVQKFKGGSSFTPRKEFAELEEFLWGDQSWSDGYFAETTGRTDERVIRRYIQNQRASAATA